MNERELVERSLLGVLLYAPRRVLEMRAWLRPDDFHDPAHQAIYASWQRLVWNSHQDAAKPDEADDVTVPDVPLDFVYFGTVWDHTQWALDGEGAVPLTPQQRRAVLRSDQDLDENIDRVPGATPAALAQRLQQGQGSPSLATPQLLQELLAAAPPPQRAAPEQYGLWLLENNIIQRVYEAGLRIQDLEGTRSPQRRLDEVDRAEEQVASDYRNWAHAKTRADPAAAPRPDLSGMELLEPDSTASDAHRQHVAVAEDSVLGHVFRDPALLRGVFAPLEPADFATSGYPELWTVLRDMPDPDTISPASVVIAQSRHADLGSRVEVDTVVTLATKSPNDLHPAQAAEAVLQAGARQRLDGAGAQMVRAATTPGADAADVLGAAAEALSDVAHAANRRPGPQRARCSVPAAPHATQVDTGLLEHLSHRAQQVRDTTDTAQPGQASGSVADTEAAGPDGPPGPEPDPA